VLNGQATQDDYAVELSQGASHFLALLGDAYAAAGRVVEAEEILGQLLDPKEHRYASPYHVAPIFFALGRTKEAFDWLETGYQERAAFMVLMKTDPRWDNVHPDPRFQDLLRRMNFPAP